MAKTKEEKKTTTAKIEKAKGRPMLHWVGKRAIDSVHSYPAQLVEQYACNETEAETNLLFHGDNKEVLAYLLTSGYRGRVNLIYIDPPFDSKADYVRKVELRGLKVPIEAETQTLNEQTQYSDIWANDNYLQFMYERLLLLKELLAIDGSIYIHMDEEKGHYIKVLADEVFGKENFQRELVWDITVLSGFKTQAQKWIRGHDTILFYTKSSKKVFNKIMQPHTQKYLDMFDKTDSDGRKYLVAHGLKRYLDEVESKGKPFGDVWDDIMSFQQQPTSGENVQYPTQKPEALLERIITASSNPNDIVLDCFIGSGTTAAVAQKLGRRWIGCDINKGAIQTTSKRLQNIIDAQRKDLQQTSLPKDGETAAEKTNPILSFKHYRINDYDLNIQHNEAFELALEYVGVTRKRTDSFFEGELGKRLVKVVPLNHPCTLLDIQAVETELKNRPDEDRDITLISLGKDSNVDKYLADYNKRNAVNKIELIELRTNEKYGNFLIHQPAWADVKIKRIDGNKVSVKVDNFNSPTIIQRLKLDETIFRERVTDFRAMIDVLLVDTSYDGKVFNICYSDVPAKKTDLINGNYELPISPESKQVAVKIIDMLGEEVLMVEKI